MSGMALVPVAVALLGLVAQLPEPAAVPRTRVLMTGIVVVESGRAPEIAYQWFKDFLRWGGHQ